MRITSKDFRKFVAEAGLKDRFIKFIEDRNSSVKLKPSVIKRAEYRLNHDGQVTIAKGRAGKPHIVSLKFVKLLPRFTYEKHPELINVRAKP